MTSMTPYLTSALSTLSDFRNQAGLYLGHGVTWLKNNEFLKIVAAALHQSAVTLMTLATPLLKTTMSVTQAHPIPSALILGVLAICIMASWSKKTEKTPQSA